MALSQTYSLSQAKLRLRSFPMVSLIHKFRQHVIIGLLPTPKVEDFPLGGTGSH